MIWEIPIKNNKVRNKTIGDEFGKINSAGCKDEENRRSNKLKPFNPIIKNIQRFLKVFSFFHFINSSSERIFTGFNPRNVFHC
jgi:hypothetical protein